MEKVTAWFHQAVLQLCQLEDKAGKAKMPLMAAVRFGCKMLYSPFPFHLFHLEKREWEGEEEELNSALRLMGIVLSQL